jgi:aminoglycoside phosphotransferase (APT) family kinase protein
LLTQFCDLFVRLHRLDWRTLADEGQVKAEDAYAQIDGWLAQAREVAARFRPVDFGPAVAWLAARRDGLACPRPAPVHRDFHPWNILVRADGSPVVIDCTGAGVTDPRFDLAWTLLLAYAYLGPTWRDRLLAEYERLSGKRVAEIEAFEAAACLRRLHDIAVSLTEGAERHGMRPETAGVIRAQIDVVQRVHDLLTARTGLRLAGLDQVLSS